MISAALLEEGVPLAGVLYRHVTDDLYEAGRNLGAFRNGHRIEVSDGALGATRTAAGPKPYVDALKDEQVSALERRPSLASLALRLAYLAEGRTDVASNTTS